MTQSAPVGLPAVRLRPDAPFGVYVHVPFCLTRCGYCDFNTYTPAELGGVNPDAWLGVLARELQLAAARLGAPVADTVFVGGGTPSLLGSERLCAVLELVRQQFGLAPGAEVSTEANPESTSPELFDALRKAGYTRISLGMQSVSPRVLATLDRVHSPGRAVAAAREALDAGFEHVNLDLIYGLPGNPTTICGGRWTRRSRQVSITSRPTHSSSKRAPHWPGGFAAASWPRPTMTSSPVATKSSTGCCRQPVSTGMRSPIGAVPAGSVGTTSATGMVANGGAPVRGRTAMSVPPDGGMSSTPTPMHSC